MENETVKLKKYLLGNLTPTEIEEIDLQVLSDETLEEKLNWAESELAEDFLEGTLTPMEIELFHKNFLVSPERKDHLKEIALLKKYSGTVRQPGETPVEKPFQSSEGFFRRLKIFLTTGLQQYPAFVVLGLLIICLGLGITWKIFSGGSNNELTRLEKEYGEMNHKDLSDLSDYQNLSGASLFSGTFRDSNSGNKLNQERLTENVFFRLALPFEASSETLFDVQVLKAQKPVFRQNQVRVYKNQSGQEIRLIVPKSVLQKGQYQIRLENPSAKDSGVIYSFAVE